MLLTVRIGPFSGTTDLPLPTEDHHHAAPSPAPGTPMSPVVTGQAVLTHVRRAWPDPGSGRTKVRWDRLAEIARDDLPLVKLVEPHHDAMAILRDLDGPSPEPESVWAVWAAEPPFARLEATPNAAGEWTLDGRKAFCSGASLVSHALVTAETPDGSRLFAVALGEGVSRDEEAPAWSGHGMSRADTSTLRFASVPAVPVGDAGAYVDRPGFWWGAIGIAACWFGGSQGVADAVENARGRLGPHGLAHLGAIRADLDNLAAVLAQAASVIDADPTGKGHQPERMALSVRAMAADVCDRVVAAAGRALGPAPLAFDREHADRVADLQVFVRQHHAERDLERLGSLGDPDE